MTTDHNSPNGEAEAVRLAEKHGGVWGQGPVQLYIFDQAQLAALITEVRRRAMEESAQECESVPHGGPFALAIRANLEEWK